MAQHKGPIPEDVKREIVVRLACYDSPTQVAKAIKEDFDLELDRRQVQLYDATRAGGTVGAELTALFNDTRARFLAEIADIPIANKAVRLRRLEALCVNAINRGNPVVAQTTMEQAAKDIGEAYTNRRQVTGNLTVDQALKALDD